MAAGSVRLGFVLHVMQVAGAEVLVREIIRRLGPRIQPTILCLDGVGAIGEQLQSKGVEVVALGRRAGRDWGLARRMARIVEEREIELLHAHQYTPLFYAGLAKLLARRRPKLLFTEHGRHYPDLVSRKRRWMNRLLFERLIDSTTAVCEFTRRSLIEVEGLAARKIEVIENGIEAECYGSADNKASAKARLGLNVARRYVTTIARFHPVKDHGTLLTAFSKVAQARADVDLLMAGDGPRREACEVMAEELQIGKRVRFLGVRDDVPALLQASDVFALTSLSEASSLTLLEAMGTGLPCVVTAVGGNGELVRDGIEGLLVARGDSDAAARAIVRILDDGLLAASMGAAGSLRVQERFLLERTIERYGRLYERLCRRTIVGRQRPTRETAAVG